MSVFAAVARRWYVAVLILGVTAYGTVQLWSEAVPEFTSSSVLSVVATPSYLAVQQSEDPAVIVTNPYGAGTTTLASLLADSVANGNVVLAPDGDAVVTVETSVLRAESFFTVEATAPTADAALAAMLAVEAQAPTILAEIQQRAGAPADQLSTAILSRAPGAPAEAYPDRSRVAIGAALAGLLVTALLCVLIDGAVRRVRRGRRSGAPAPAPAPAPPAERTAQAERPRSHARADAGD
ncbi:hypothetical protein [Pengzhenrongella sicca]|uniref:Capsular polysaccharide biosynthesis protein n=1 Tax=Pengzhenrongella sicca TaxID=2819238 RepID=A0A8A4ZGP2_9MICO|nr:hypothetical protein [Pengzhenrongella sicca]QTE29657.1 hypothetical protein J4E96_00915 [Pengzhenrongella sicca]